MTDLPYFIHPTAVIDPPVDIGEGTRVWHFCHVSERVKLGRGCTLGQNVYVAPRVHIGANVKIQNNVSVYEGVVLEDDVFCGPCTAVPDYALMLGVPAKPSGWVSRHGHVLGEPDAEGLRRCPESGWRYREEEPWHLRCLDWDEELPLP
jgi:UDP-2-acetamido-3-amino-2,3-dideoxy-glucuronate N-acetyltransferase